MRGLKNAGKPSQAAGCISDSPRAPRSRWIPFLGLASLWPLTLLHAALWGCRLPQNPNEHPAHLTASEAAGGEARHGCEQVAPFGRVPGTPIAPPHARMHSRAFFGRPFDFQAQSCSASVATSAAVRSHAGTAVMRTGSECVRFRIGFRIGNSLSL
jgi:hypothetical protein